MANTSSKATTVQAEDTTVKQSYVLPELGVVIEAGSATEAAVKAKKLSKEQ